jgi:hypothetical protein
VFTANHSEPSIKTEQGTFYAAYCKLCDVLPDAFVEYLPTVIPKLLTMCDKKPVVKVLDQDHLGNFHWLCNYMFMLSKDEFDDKDSQFQLIEVPEFHGNSAESYVITGNWWGSRL